MSAEIINMEGRRPRIPGNGAREALIAAGYPDWSADIILAKLWYEGFKIVPLEPSDE